MTLSPSLILRDEPPYLCQTSTQVDVDIFYALSYEFVRYLSSEYGIKNLWLVVQLVGDGTEFDEAFNDVIGKQYIDAYNEFSKNWLYSPVIIKYHEWKDGR